MNRKSIVPFVVVLALGLAHTASADLVGWWTFDEGAGTNAYDYSGSGNDGIVNGEPQWVDGYFDGALEFDGSNGYVDCGNDPSVDLTKWTIAFWLKTNENKDFSGFVVKGLDAAENYEVLAYGDGHIHMPITFTDGTRGMGNTAAGVIVVGEWAHFAYSYDPGEGRRFYKNGGLIFEDTESRIPQTSASPLSIGNEPPLTRVVNGTMDDVRIFSHVLTEAEMAAVMEGGKGYPYAVAPFPKDGSMVEATSTQLSWGVGAFAASHDVYFGVSLEDVNQATPESGVFQGNQTATEYAVQNLIPGATYYWRVDEVNDVNAASPWKGNVWNFWVQPLTAYNPSPADGVPYVPLNPDLAWEGGMGALFHTVYFGESFEEVDGMTFGGWMVADATVAPAQPQLYGPLQTETTYYWRVDEFAMTGTTNKGEVWSFTTLPEIAITDPDLTGWWTLDEGVGATSLDWSGHGNHGSFVGEPMWVDGYHGGALEFGGGDYVDTGKGAGDLEIDGGKPKTTMAWALTRGFNGGGLWDLGSNTDGRNWSVRTMTTTDTWRVQRYGYPTYDFDVTVPTLNEWAHFALVYDGAGGGDDSRLYVNGEVAGNQTVELDTNPTTRTFQIGLWSGTSFDGVIDDVRVYKKALTEAEIAEAMRGNPLLAGSPNPAPGAIVDIRDATMLTWTAGDTAASHDVYFGADRAAVAAVGNDAPEFQGNQPGTSFSLAGLVEFGGGDYFWRIDEVEADETVQTGYVWKFTIPDHLIVDDFESYSNEVGSRAFEKWIDGIGFTQPVDTPGNDTGALVGHDIWTIGTPYTTIMETGNVHGGNQAMPIYYDNTLALGISEVDRTFTPGQNWTVEGVTTLVVHIRGEADNTGNLYVEINGANVPYDGDPTDIASGEWIAWEIDLASVGVSLTNITTLTIGIEGGQTGVLYVDDIILTKP